MATFLVSNGNNIVASNFTHFVANDVNADKLPVEMKTGCLWEKHKLNVKTWSPNFRHTLLNWWSKYFFETFFLIDLKNSRFLDKY